jgi:apolipoprotein N-acyltransferase
VAPLTRWLSIGACAVIGFAAWQGAMWTIPLSILMPCVVASQSTRLRASLAAFAYYAAASIPLVKTAKTYWPTIGGGALLVWALAAMLLALPWFVFWNHRPSLRPFDAAAALAASTLPPLCILGWASPLVSAGVLFPGSAWLGLLAVFAMPGLLLHRPTRSMAAACAVAAATLLNITAKPAGAPGAWEAKATAYRQSALPDPEADFQIEQNLQSLVQASAARYMVFPEGTIRIWTDATDLEWLSVLANLGKTVLAGASLPGDTGGYDNALVIFNGQSRRAILQRIPIPGGMWNPFKPRRSFALHIFHSGIAEVGDQRVAALICYEQLLVWPMLRSAVERPTLLVAVANDAWTSNTAIPEIQRSCVWAWARLFGLPVISAINT